MSTIKTNDGKALEWSVDLTELRALRLDFWQQAKRAREHQRHYEGLIGKPFTQSNRAKARAYELQANKHIRAVQALNDLFTIGDSAEKDDVKS